MDSVQVRNQRASRATSDSDIKRSSSGSAPRFRKKRVARRSTKWARQENEDDILTDTDDETATSPAPTQAPQPSIPQRPTTDYDPEDQAWIAWIAANPEDAEVLELEWLRKQQEEAQQPTASSAPPTQAVETPTPGPTSGAPLSTGDAAISSPTPSSQSQPGPTNGAIPPPYEAPPPRPKGIGPGGMAAAIIIPLLGIAFLAALVYIIMKRRQRRRRVISAQEKRMANDSNGYSGIPQTFQYSGASEEANTRAPSLLSPASDTSYNPTAVPRRVLARVPSQPPPFQALYPNPQPVILGPMNTSNSGAYMTGLDTDDVLSVAEPSAQRESQQFLAAKVTPAPEDPDEPPPPYRPRSIANLISRETSRRNGSGSLRGSGSGSNRRSRGMSGVEESLIVQDGRRPEHLDDGDDSVSVMSQPQGRNRFRLENDGFSEVSDLSYQSSIRHPR